MCQTGANLVPSLKHMKQENKRETNPHIQTQMCMYTYTNAYVHLCCICHRKCLAQGVNAPSLPPMPTSRMQYPCSCSLWPSVLREDPLQLYNGSPCKAPTLVGALRVNVLIPARMDGSELHRAASTLRLIDRCNQCNVLWHMCMYI